MTSGNSPMGQTQSTIEALKQQRLEAEERIREVDIILPHLEKSLEFILAGRRWRVLKQQLDKAEESKLR